MKSWLIAIAALLMLVCASTADAQTKPFAIGNRLLCTLPWGGSLSSGGSTTAYSSTTPAANCSTVSETRTCTGSTLSGSFTNQSCTNGCVAQTANWSSCTGSAGALANGGSQSVTNTNGSYTGSVTVTCNMGTLSQSGATCNLACKSNGTVCAANGECCSNTCIAGMCAASAPVACGSSYGGSFSSPPSSNLCSAQGIQVGSVTTNATTYDWTCRSTVDGSMQACTATRTFAGCSSQSVAWSSCSGTVGALAHNGSSSVSNTAANYSGSVTATCNNGTINQSGASCTGTDSTPDAFAFTDVTNIAVSTLTSSNIIMISGLTTTSATSISGSSAQYQICSDAACSSVLTSWTTGASTISNNQYIQLRFTSSASNSTALSTNMTIGGVTDNWSVTTASAGCTSDAQCGPVGGGEYGAKCIVNACWYFSSSNIPCTTVCSGHGGTNDASINYSGTGGTLANCYAVAGAMPVVATLGQVASGDTTAGVAGAGCFFIVQPTGQPGQTIMRIMRNTAAPTVHSANSYRYCSCNN